MAENLLFEFEDGLLALFFWRRAEVVAATGSLQAGGREPRDRLLHEVVEYRIVQDPSHDQRGL